MNIAWIGEAKGQHNCKVWPLTIKRKDGKYQPAILHEIGGSVWVQEAEFRVCDLVEAAK